ncbi:hypothetical protein [Streptomyces mirabilis]
MAAEYGPGEPGVPVTPLRGPAATAVLTGELIAHAMRHDLR